MQRAGTLESMAPDRILQPGTGAIRGEHYVSVAPDTTLWGRLPGASDSPALTIASGTEVTVDTLSHEGVLEDQGRDPRAFFGGHGVDPDAVLEDAVALASGGPFRDPAVDGPHVVLGPIAVEGAEPGDVLTMTLVEAVPRVPYGVISNRHGRGALAGELPLGDGTYSAFARVLPATADAPHGWGVLPRFEGGDWHDPAETMRFPLDPFLGIMGVATGDGARAHSVPPGAHGGNIDIRLLTVGASLHVPVQVPGAFAHVGDPHFAQGDGEVALTAMEASLRATVRFDLMTQADAVAAFGELVGPIAETAEFLIPTGIDLDLDEAMRKAVRASIALLGARWGVEPSLAYAYLSAATDFRISQVVDIVSGVHATIRKADFA